ncbi:hypothetical protein ANN_09424 [Periplaneta americana]|uniref:Uncharacterized protein n=1 Tax=Periplaneta americana TaxID=6978 RepID=A0ABQ8TLN4_PERAM|nr:hypothetical protein ANN_09424 [Periplaneta americana]
MVGSCEGGNEPPGSLKAIIVSKINGNETRFQIIQVDPVILLFYNEDVANEASLRADGRKQSYVHFLAYNLFALS